MTFAEVNPAVNLLLPGAYFERSSSGRLYLMQPDSKYYPKVLWRLRSDRTWPLDRKACSVSGGTVVQSLAQLSLWMKDEPRRPMRYWDCIASEMVWGKDKDGRAFKLVDYLSKSSYPLKTDCVLCGAKETSDWWSCDKVNGPCCRFGQCQNRDKQ